MNLDKVDATEFKKIVSEMKPKIGVLGGRYFKTAKRTYTMNQITNKYFELLDARKVSLFGKEGSEISALIVDKSKEANQLLKKASCFQKKMTKIKQKWGNRIFKNRHSKFIGKKAAIETMAAALLIHSSSNPPLFRDDKVVILSGAKLPDFEIVKNPDEVQVISDKDALLLQTIKEFQNKVILYKDKLIALEVMFNAYLHQMRNEMRLLEEELPQGYVYTISNSDPITNHLQALALGCLHKETPFQNLKVCAFDDFEDQVMIDALIQALPDKAVVSSSLLYKEGIYLENSFLPEDIRQLCEKATLVIHNEPCVNLTRDI